MPGAASAPRAPELPRVLQRGETAVLTHDASFTEVELSGLALTAGHARGVTLDTVRLRDCDLSESRVEHLRIVHGELGGCNLANLQARGATFANVAIECGRLTGIDLAEATLKDVAFSDCRIDLASFRGARMQRVTFSDCVLAETDFLEARLESVRMHGCDLRNADLRGARLQACELRRNDLTGLRGVESLRGAALEWADILDWRASGHRRSASRCSTARADRAARVGAGSRKAPGASATLYCSPMAATRFTGTPAVDREAHPRQRAVSRSCTQALAALAGYCALSALLYGRAALGDIRHVVVGFGQAPPFYGHDQSAYVWSLAWAARALTHLQNPFLAHEIFAPVGYNLAWAASILGPGLLSAPLTLALGAVATYNLLALAAPAGAAWTAFLLCRHVSGRVVPALAGGLLFGFGAYGTGEAINHLNLALVALVPLAVLLVLRRYEGLTSRRRFVLALGVLLGLQLWTSTEVFASMTMFAGLAFLLAALLASPARRPRIWLCMGEALGALLVALVLAAPLLYYALSHPNPVSEISTADAGADLANFVIPSAAIWLHGWKAVARSGAQLHGNITEQLAYLGIPLILLLGAYALECRRSRLARLLTILIVVSAVSSLGAHLFVDGAASGVTLPWSLVDRLPLLRFASPGRFTLYMWLAAALAVSVWLSRPARTPLRWVTFALVVVSLVPNLDGPWGTHVDAPPLMRAPLLARYVPKGATVLALPFGIWGDSMFWQVQADFRFRLAGGYVSVSPPAAYRRYIYLLRALSGGPIEGHPNQRICGFLRMTGTSVIVLREGAPGLWARLLRPLRVPAVRAGDFWVYELGAPGGAPGQCVPPARQPAPSGMPVLGSSLPGLGETMLGRNRARRAR